MRIRTIKPEFWRSTDVSKYPIETRLLFLGLWNYVDDNGVGYDRTSNIAADLFADDLEENPRETLARVRRGLDALAAGGQIDRYQGPDGRNYLFVINWHHQKIDRPSTPRKPLPDGQIRMPREDDASPRRVLDEPSSSVPGNREQGTGEQGAREKAAERAAAALKARKNRFDEFYSLYPKKAAKGEAKERWDKVVVDVDPDEIIAGLKRLLPWFDAQVEGGKDYRPAAGPWLNKQRWLDEPTLPAQSRSPHAHIKPLEPDDHWTERSA